MKVQQAIVVIEKADYKNIHKIERGHGYYKAKALDIQDNRAKLTVEPATGAVSVRRHD